MNQLIEVNEYNILMEKQIKEDMIYGTIPIIKALICFFREVIDLQKSTAKHIVKAIDPVYIKTLRSIKTNTIQEYAPAVLAYLFTTYITIELEVLRGHKLKVCDMVYALMDPPITICNEIEELENLGHATVYRIRCHNLWTAG